MATGFGFGASDTTCGTIVIFRFGVSDDYFVDLDTWHSFVESQLEEVKAQSAPPPNPTDFERPPFAWKPIDARRGAHPVALPRARVARWRSLKEKRAAWGIAPGHA